MDIRTTTIEKKELVNESIDTRQMSLEIANNIETMKDLKDIIYSQAANEFRVNSEKNRFYSYGRNYEIDDNPGYIYIMGLMMWGLVVNNRNLPISSFVVVFAIIHQVLNYRRELICRSQPDYKDFKKLEKSLDEIYNLRRKNTSFKEKYNIYKTFFLGKKL